jgi:dephospho-CoA kinase
MPAFSLVVTGGIATGKSACCRLLREAFGPEEARFFDADACVHGLLTSPPVVEEIAACLGRDVLAPDGTLDRVRVSAKVFQDAALRKSLEGILHPLVRARCFEAQERSTAPGSATRLFVAEIPLFYETGFPMAADARLVVACSPRTQRERLLARSPDRSPHQIDQRLAAQLPILEKVALASHVLWNGGTREAFQQQLSLFQTCLRAKLPPPEPNHAPKNL